MSSYRSRKFIVTMTGMILTVVLAVAGKMDAHVALVMSAAIAGYHLANAYTHGSGNGKE